MKSVEELKQFIMETSEKYGYRCYTGDMDASVKEVMDSYEDTDDNSILMVISYFKRALISGLSIEDGYSRFAVTLRDNTDKKYSKFTVSMKDGKEEECFKSHFLNEMVNIGFVEERLTRVKKTYPAGYNLFDFSEETFNQMLNDIMHSRKMKPFDSNFINHNSAIIMLGFERNENGLFVVYDCYVKDTKVKTFKTYTSTIVGVKESLEKAVEELSANGYLNSPDIPEDLLEITYTVLGQKDFNTVLETLKPIYESK